MAEIKLLLNRKGKEKGRGVRTVGTDFVSITTKMRKIHTKSVFEAKKPYIGSGTFASPVGV